jgi:hypothetical protein
MQGPELARLSDLQCQLTSFCQVCTLCESLGLLISSQRKHTARTDARWITSVLANKSLAKLARCGPLTTHMHVWLHIVEHHCFLQHQVASDA